MGKRRLFIGARWLITLGVILLAVYAPSVTHRVMFSRLALREFNKSRVIPKPEYGKARVGLQIDLPKEERLACDRPPLRKAESSRSRI